MKRAMVSLWCVLVLLGAAAASERPWVEGKSAKAAFAANGSVLMRLGAGDATITVNPSAKEITVTTETQESGKVSEIKNTVRVTGTYGEIHVNGPKLRYKIEIPPVTKMKIRMSAGDLNLNGLDSELDVELHAGDCTIKLGAPADQFGPIDLSVNAGDVNAQPFNANKGGLFRHFNNGRTAKYRIHAHVGAGDLTVQ